MNTAADQAAARLAERQHGVITRRQAIELGLPSDVVEGRVSCGEWEAVFRGVYRLPGTRRTFGQTVAAGRLAAGRDAVASHRSAAVLYGIPGVPRWVEVTVPAQRQVRAQGLIVHRTRLLLPEDRGVVGLIPVTSASRTIVDLAGEYPKQRVGRMLDHCLANRLLTRLELEERIDAIRSRSGGATAVVEELLAERPVSARPMGSDFEVDMFMALRAAGVAEPIPQYRVILPDGTERFIDFAYPAVRLALEADGYVWHCSRSDWERDRIRSHELIALGWTPLPITWGHLKTDPAAVADTVRRALESR